MKIFKKEYYINNSLNKKIVLLSDVHYYSKKDIYHLNKILDSIRIIKPNYICIVGDLIDEYYVKDIDLFYEWLNKLSKISKVIVSLGNHEFYKNKENRIFELNKDYINKLNRIDNLFFLDNQNYVIDNINFIGITIPIENYFNNMKFSINSKLINKKYYNIVLCHSPIDINLNSVYNCSLILCGHMHGGLIPRIFRKSIKNRGLIGADKKLFPKYSYGHIKISETNLIISSGIKVISHMNKFKILTPFYSSEIVIINI